MSAYEMHPEFGTLEAYRVWRKSWVVLFKTHTAKYRKKRAEMKRLQVSAFKTGGAHGLESFAYTIAAEKAATAQRELRMERAMGHKLMTLLEDAKARAQRIREMQKSIEEQMKSFPMTIDAPSFDFHFNKVSIQFPFMPMWTIKCKGKSYYVNHLDATGMAMTTRETPEHPATKGAIRFRRGTLTLNADGTATLTRSDTVELPRAA